MNFDAMFLSKERTDGNIIAGIDSLYTASQKVKDSNSNVKKWDDYEKAYRSKLTEDADANLPAWKSKMNNSQAFKIIETIKPFIIDGKPKFVAKPLKYQTVEKVGIINQLFDYMTESDKTGFEEAKVLLVHNALVLGTGILKVGFSYEFDALGEVMFKNISPRRIYPDPSATSMRNCRYVIERSIEDIDDIITRFPKKSKELEELRDIDSYESNDSLSFGTRTIPRDTYVNKDIYSNSIEILYCFIKDTSLKKAKNTAVMKYPNGRLIITAPNGILLYDGENPLNVPIPYVDVKIYPVPETGKESSFWGVSELDPIMSSFLEATKNYRRISNILFQHAYPKIRQSSNVEEEYSNDPTEIVYADPGEIELLVPPQQMTSELLFWVRTLESNIEDISGQHPSAQGAEPAEAKSGVAIKALQSFAVKRDKLKAFNIYRGLASAGKMAIKIASKLYPPNKVIAITSSSPEKLFELKVINQLDGEGRVINETSLDDIEFDMLVRIESGLFSTRETRLQEAMQLYQLGIYTPDILLKKIDDPDAQKVLEALRQQQQAQMEAYAAGQQGQPPNLGGDKFGMAAKGTDLVQKING